VSKLTAGAFLIDTLVESGVKRIYGITGDSLNALADATHRNRHLQWVHVRHEEVAAFAAGAEAHLTQQLAVCAGSSGPGNLHLINGLYDCQRSRVPVLAIAAQIPSTELGTGYFQETHPEHIFEECSHYRALVSDPDQLPRVLKVAVETALSKRGVSVVILPGDIAWKKVDAPVERLPISPAASHVRPSDAQIIELAQTLNASSNITILAGAGCAGAHEELVALAAQLQAPIVHAMRGKEFIEYENPYDVGMTGLLGFASGYYAMKNADVLLMLGTDFPYVQFYPEATTIQIDERQEQLGRRTRVHLGLVGDVKQTLKLVQPLLESKASDLHLKRALRHYADTRRELDDLAQPGSDERSIHPQYLARSLSELAEPDAIFTCDVGTPTIWAARYLKMNGKRRLLGSFTHGSMANALPQAIGAQLTHPDRQVISLSGDGGLAMLLGDLATLKQYQLPIKVIVFNNQALAFVELEMMAAGLIQNNTELENPDFAALARSIGIAGFRVEHPDELAPVLEASLRTPEPALIDVHVRRFELSMPPHITLDQVKGFGLFAMKAVLSGKTSELIDLARTNLWR
jgi:pyruvate dehydrogenase (quinone)